MNVELFTDEIERVIAERPHLDAHAKGTLRSMLRRLIARAEPGNMAFQVLVQDYGFQGDYLEGDHGEAPKGANW